MELMKSDPYFTELYMSQYNKAVIKKTDHHKSDVENKKWGARTGGLRVSGRFNPEPDLDNANVGR